jgi:uncharacterized protein
MRLQDNCIGIAKAMSRVNGTGDAGHCHPCYTKLVLPYHKVYTMLGKLDNNQINNILSSQVIGRLACADGYQPYIVPVTYTYDGEYIYGQTNIGTKLAILRSNPLVSFEVDRMLDMQNWQSVVVLGEFEELEGEEADKARAILFERVFPLMTSSTVHKHEHESSTDLDDSSRVKYVLYRIKIKEVSGRFEKQ